MDFETHGAANERDADRHDVVSEHEAGDEANGAVAHARGVHGFRRLLAVALVAGGLLTAGSAALVNAASPSPLTSPAPAATGGATGKGVAAAPGGATNPARHCDQPSTSGSAPSSSGATQSY